MEIAQQRINDIKQHFFLKCERSMYAYQGLHGLVSFTCTFAKSEYLLFKTNSKNISYTPLHIIIIK